MATTAPVLISVEEYLRTSYRPDCDYVDGEVLERNMGEVPHGRLQSFFGRFAAHEDEWQIEVLTEQRVQVAPLRYRIPDVMLAALPNPDELIVRTPPLLCVEIFSSKDRIRNVQERADDYAKMGVRATWAVDPWKKLTYAAHEDGVLHLVEERLSVQGTKIAIDVQAIWNEMERLERRAAGKPS